MPILPTFYVFRALQRNHRDWRDVCMPLRGISNAACGDGNLRTRRWPSPHAEIKSPPAAFESGAQKSRRGKPLRLLNEAYESLKPHLKPEHPKILLGAEVLYNHALVSCDDTPKLCLQETDYLLWEMPYTQITSAIVSDTEELAGLNQLKIMVAHIERYLHFTSYNELSELMSLDVIGQINAVSLTKFSSRSKIKKLIKDGFVYLLGTDYHRTTSGHALLGEAEDIIRSKFDERMIKRIANNGEKVLANEPIHKLHSL